MQSVCTQNLRKPNTEQEGLHTEEAALRSTQGDFSDCRQPEADTPTAQQKSPSNGLHSRDGRNTA